MATFMVMKRFLALLGVFQVNSTHGLLLERLLRLMTITVQSYAVLTTSWYFVFQAETLEQRAAAIPLMNGFIYTLMKFVLILWNRVDILKLLGRIQRTVDTRNSHIQKEILIFKRKYLEIR